MKLNITVEEWEHFLKQPGQGINFKIHFMTCGFFIGSEAPDAPEYTVFDKNDIYKFQRNVVKLKLTALQVFLIHAAIELQENPQVFLDYEKTDDGKRNLIKIFEKMKSDAGYTEDEFLDPAIASLKDPTIEYKNEELTHFIDELNQPGYELPIESVDDSDE